MGTGDGRRLQWQGFEREVGGAGGDVENSFRPIGAEQLDGPLSPEDIDPGTQEVIQEVITRRDPVKELSNILLLVHRPTSMEGVMVQGVVLLQCHHLRNQPFTRFEFLARKYTEQS